jgi:hypothetical protein
MRDAFNPVPVLVMIAAALVLGPGCLPNLESKPAPATTSSEASPATSSAPAPVPQAAPAAAPLSAGLPSDAEPPNAATTAQSVPGTSPRIKLSSGVALPQSLPGGTTMGFSVDYQFVEGGPGTCAHLWVIQPTTGQPVASLVSLSSSGTLEAFVPELSPDSGPFQTQILEECMGTRRILSNLEPLR